MKFIKSNFSKSVVFYSSILCFKDFKIIEHIHLTLIVVGNSTRDTLNQPLASSIITRALHSQIHTNSNHPVNDY